MKAVGDDWWHLRALLFTLVNGEMVGGDSRSYLLNCQSEDGFH
jgi:hypothetical protein